MPIGQTETVTNSKILHRKDIWPGQSKNQEHLHGPLPDATTLHQAVDNFLILKTTQHPAGRNDSRLGLGGNVQDGQHLGLRKTRPPDEG